MKNWPSVPWWKWDKALRENLFIFLQNIFPLSRDLSEATRNHPGNKPLLFHQVGLEYSEFRAQTIHFLIREGRPALNSKNPGKNCEKTAAFYLKMGQIPLKTLISRKKIPASHCPFQHTFLPDFWQQH